MPRTPRNPGSGKRPVNTPASGPGAGSWGGPAKGASTSRIKPGDPDGIRALRWDADNIAHKEEIAAQMRGVLYYVALKGEGEAARINAADKLLDRIEGKAVQRQDVTSKGERLGYVITAPAEAEDADAWARQHQPK
ncbi:MAG TPA: hypothetical protein VGN96_11215 [Roseococcus sp.]|nr:hypothetical protein [Roseococcus sp.]